MSPYPQFLDRADAGRRLAATLARFRSGNTLVLALPRGGVPVAFEVARTLGAELDVLIVRKIGAPGQPELGIGAVVDGESPQVVINRQLAALAGADDTYVEAETQRQLAEIARRKRAYRGDRPNPDVAGRTVILVDDGIATGGTMRAALRALRRKQPERLVMAVPVAAPDSIAELALECDEIVCLAQPFPFHAVGVHYADFQQTEDDEVVRLLAAARRGRTGPQQR